MTRLLALLLAVAALLVAAAPATAAVPRLQDDDDAAWEWDLESYCEDAARRPTAESTAACVAALERVLAGEATDPGQACKGVSKRKPRGQRGGPPHSQCVTAAAWLLEDLAEAAAEEDEEIFDDEGLDDGDADDLGDDALDDDDDER
ncbi:MAG TPA: hypothetical protein VIL49_06995 [Capillimicrobium sp.]|jgi:hypothetical protein